MGHFMPEFHKLNITESDGHAMTVLISMSLRPKSVYFELHRIGIGYKLYWCFETPVEEMLKIFEAAEFEGKEKIKSYDDFKSNEHVQRLIGERAVQDSKIVKDNDIIVFEKIITNGLPELDRTIYIGLDGHSYTITIEGTPRREYKTWGLIPKEWAVIRDLVEVLRRYARLSEMYCVSGIV